MSSIRDNMKIITALDVGKHTVKIIGICTDETEALDVMHSYIENNKLDNDRVEVETKFRIKIINKQIGYLYNSKCLTHVYEIIDYVGD